MKQRERMELISARGDVQLIGYIDPSPKNKCDTLKKAAVMYLGKQSKCNYATFEATSPQGWRIKIS